MSSSSSPPSGSVVGIEPSGMVGPAKQTKYSLKGSYQRPSYLLSTTLKKYQLGLEDPNTPPFLNFESKTSTAHNQFLTNSSFFKIVFIGKTRILDQLIFEEKRKECNISKIGYFNTVPAVKSFETMHSCK